MDEKKIVISGTNNRYMIKKVMKEPMEQKKRADIVKLELLPDLNQLELLSFDDIHHSTVIQQIEKKISGYKQQDLKKKLFDVEKFVKIEFVIDRMRETELKCYYCKIDVMILYENAREGKQWSLDRIDNDVGHNQNNCHIACLKCNLKRRRTDDAKFLFTQQMNIIKQL